MDFGLLSVPSHFLLCLLATNKVVPEPQKKSATTSPSFVEAKIILSSNFSGF